jgi:acetylornithine/succinyldiaminopimelate/putrescine aminotransferase
MATIDYTLEEIEGGRAVVVTWAALGNADNGQAFDWASYSDRSAHIAGTFGGATVVMEGSNTTSNYVTSTDTLGNAVSVTSLGLKQINEIVRRIRPRTSGGTGTAVTVTMVAARRAV